MEVRRVAPAGASLGEGPHWDAARGVLWWLDIKGGRLHRYDPRDGAATVRALAVRLTALGGTTGARLVAAGDEGFVLLDPETGAIAPLAPIAGEPAGNRCNDGKVGPDGAFWTGTMDDAEERASGAVHRLDPDGTVTRFADGMRVPNGPAFDAAGAMYLSDSARRITVRHRVAAGGGYDAGTPFARFDEAHGFPDGMCVDRADHVWIAFWDGGVVRRLDPTGRIVAEVRLPVRRPTSCAFGGPDLATLYVTSARTGLDAAALAAQPLAGALFAIAVDVPGAAVPPYGGGGRD